MTPRLSRILLASALFLAETWVTQNARADETRSETAPTIAVVCVPEDRFGLRVVAELEALGFRTVILDAANEPVSREALEASARSVGAIAAIRAVLSQRGAWEVWIADRVTGKTVLRAMTSEDPATDSDALALRTVELLRASFLEIALPQPSRGEIAATPVIREKLDLMLPPAAAQIGVVTPTLRLSLAASALMSPGGFSPESALDLGLDWMPSEHVGIRAFAVIPLGNGQLQAAQGSADLAVLLAGAAMRFGITRRASTWNPSLDLGVTAISVKTTGSPSPGFVADKASVTTAAPFVRIGLAAALTPTFRFRADVLGTLVLQGLSVRFAGNEVATWGSPIVLTSIGADFGWF